MSDLNLSEETEHLPRLWTDTLCNKSEKLSRNRSKVNERICERSKNCTLVEQSRDKDSDLSRLRTDTLCKCSRDRRRETVHLSRLWTDTQKENESQRRDAEGLRKVPVTSLDRHTSHKSKDLR